MKIEEAKKEVTRNSKLCADLKNASVDLLTVLNIIDKIELDKPKRVVPQIIFDVIESFDEDVNYLHEHMSYQSDEVREWLNNNEREFYEAWLAYPNIEVEKEKLYTVEIPNPYDKQIALRLEKWGEGKVRVVPTHSTNDFTDDMFLTEQEIRKDFDWAWQFRKDVENE
ncbi:TPA: DUF1642 domain-containing protein [Streptococcus agalactiae]